MKLVFTRRTRPHPHCIKVDWSPDDNEVSWISLSYQPTAEELAGGWRVERKNLNLIINGFLRSCVPEGSHIYARLASDFKPEYDRILDDVCRKGLTTISEIDTNSRKGVRGTFGRWLWDRPPWYVYVGAVNLTHVSDWYSRATGWQITPYRFLISNQPIPDWAKKMAYFNRNLVQKEFLAQTGSVLWNHYEDGMEFAGVKVKVDAVEAESRHLAQKLGVAFEIQAIGVPI